MATVCIAAVGRLIGFTEKKMYYGMQRDKLVHLQVHLLFPK